MARDDANRKALRRLGWRRIAIWECELRRPERLERRLRRAFGIGSRGSVAWRRCVATYARAEPRVVLPSARHLTFAAPPAASIC
jgi:hypothetical protein